MYRQIKNVNILNILGLVKVCGKYILKLCTKVPNFVPQKYYELYPATTIRKSHIINLYTASCSEVGLIPISDSSIGNQAKECFPAHLSANSTIPTNLGRTTTTTIGLESEGQVMKCIGGHSPCHAGRHVQILNHTVSPNYFHRESRRSKFSRIFCSSTLGKGRGGSNQGLQTKGLLEIMLRRERRFNN